MIKNSLMIKTAIATMKPDELKQIIRNAYGDFTATQKYEVAQALSSWHDNNPKEPNPFAALAGGTS
jgi:hypothetical protein